MDLISRKDAIEAMSESLKRVFPEHRQIAEKCLKALPSAQPERLTDDDFETIRIHLSAFKERLCNQRRWEEAEEYQRIIDRFMAFASAQPEIIRCRDCLMHGVCRFEKAFGLDGYCSQAERG